ncbi:MAG: S66 peptidase family protein [Bacilli bacterium]
MRYPKFLTSHGRIGIVSPSFGIEGNPYQPRYQHACQIFMTYGHSIVEDENVSHGIIKAASASATDRAEAWMKSWEDSNLDVLLSAAGGERMMEILPHLNWTLIANSHESKWFMGYSDNTVLTFLLPILADTAAIYGPHVPEFGMIPWDLSLSESYNLLRGKTLIFHSYPFYEIHDQKFLPGNALAPYNLTEPTTIRSLHNEKTLHLSGRLIGGCLDLLPMLIGTPFDKVSDFITRYYHDGFLWFLETSDLSSLATLRSLWQLKEAGWFRNCKGILFGRPANQETPFDVTFEDVLHDIFDALSIPVVTGLDIGHVPPSWSIITGAMGDFLLTEGYATLQMILKE